MPSFHKEDFKPNGKVYTYHCRQCSRVMYSNRPHVQFCSSTCRNYHWRNKGSLAALKDEQPVGKVSLSDAQVDQLIKEIDEISQSTQVSAFKDTTEDMAPEQGLEEAVSLLALAKTLEEQMKELQALKQSLQWCIEEELLDKMRLQGTDTIGTNLLPLLAAMEDKHKWLRAFVDQLKRWEMSMPTPIKWDGK